MNDNILRWDAPPDVLTVGELTGRIRGSLENNFHDLWVVGEVSGLARPRSGHVYLTLKDDKAQLGAVMWRRTAERVRFNLEDGLEVQAFGSITVYEPRGRYQMIINRIQPRGIGALQLAFEQLKKKLAEEGLFDPAHKKPLPLIPGRIGIVTSATGAAIRDIIRQIDERFPNFNALIVPVRVQGKAAAGEIAEAIRYLNSRDDIEVMIVGRGGGSIEDLWAFNEEVVARAIYASRIPVISAVGHEIDVTIADLVADVRALTPTAAGEIVVPDKSSLHGQIDQLATRLRSSLVNKIDLARSQLAALATATSLDRPIDMIRRHQQHLDELMMRMQSTASHRVEIAREQLGTFSGRLDALSPMGVLARAYSITLKNGAAVSSAAEVKAGDRIETVLAKGRIESTVDAVHPENE